MSAIEVDVWADVVSPWCYIAKRRLEFAIAESQHPTEVTVRYHAFEVDPTAPVCSGTPAVEALAARTGMSKEEAASEIEQAALTARPEGIDIHVDTTIRANSLDAHRLIWLANVQGGPALQGAMVERLFSAHFCEGKAIDDHEVLQRIAGEAGVDGRRVAAVLAGDHYTEEVRAVEEAARFLGITDVPYAIANEKVAVAGAQTVEVFGELLRAALDDRPQQREAADASRPGLGAPAHAPEAP